MNWKAHLTWRKSKVQALSWKLKPPLCCLINHEIIDLAAKNRLPTMYYNQRYVELGGLMCYGRRPFFEDPRVASMVDKILKGTEPADIPVEQPMEFELVINLKTAKTLGVAIP